MKLNRIFVKYLIGNIAASAENRSGFVISVLFCIQQQFEHLTNRSHHLH